MTNDIEITELTPGLSIHNFHQQLFNGIIPINIKGHLSSLEMVLVPRMQGTILDRSQDHGLGVLQVSFPFYPKPLYVLENHTIPASNKKSFPLPSKDQIITTLFSCLGKFYLWGGNYGEKTLSLKRFCSLIPQNRQQNRVIYLDGIDCSGLIFFAANYNIPRNTKELASFGESRSIHSVLKPLDLIVTQGHVMIVLNDNLVIQSRQNRGVYLSTLSYELSKLERQKKWVEKNPLKDEFTIRRWY